MVRRLTIHGRSRVLQHVAPDRGNCIPWSAHPQVRAGPRDGAPGGLHSAASTEALKCPLQTRSALSDHLVRSGRFSASVRRYRSSVSRGSAAWGAGSAGSTLRGWLPMLGGADWLLAVVPTLATGAGAGGSVGSQ